MTKLYEGIKNFMLRPVLYTGLATMTLTRCDKADAPKQNQPAKVRQEMEKTYFDNWGFVDKLNGWPGKNSLDIELGDFDGDGDLDIAVATNEDGLKVYENRIPRKE